MHVKMRTSPLSEGYTGSVSSGSCPHTLVVLEKKTRPVQVRSGQVRSESHQAIAVALLLVLAFFLFFQPGPTVISFHRVLVCGCTPAKS